MKYTILIFILFISAFVIQLSFGKNSESAELAQEAISDNPETVNKSIKALRGMREKGLDVLTETYSAEINEFSQSGTANEKWQKISFALDGVAMQKDAYASKLYWFTDFEEAKRAAASANKPILSLRLLGNLNEEFSCANSRFFRALLYSNSKISNYLRENYILHWKSVRPAPKVTIDFGDGRKIERTVTGNSIHYILDEKGRIIDGVPGLYNPQSFLKYLKTGKDFHNLLLDLSEQRKAEAIKGFHKFSFENLESVRTKTLRKAGVILTAPKTSTKAIEVAPFAATKMLTEAAILTSIKDNFASSEPNINLEDWNKLANLYASDTKFDESTLKFIRRQNAKTNLTAAQMNELLANLKKYVSLDTVRNDFLFHAGVYKMLESNIENVDNFNPVVYRDLFRTPDSDKWLGLYSTDVYTALDGSGIIEK